MKKTLAERVGAILGLTILAWAVLATLTLGTYELGRVIGLWS